MKFLLVILFAGASLLDQLLVEIDSVSCYVAGKERELGALSEQVRRLPAGSVGRYDQCIRTGQAYVKFSSDSSLLYFSQAEQIAMQLGIQELLDRARLHNVRVLSSIGFFKEADDLIGMVDTVSLAPQLRSLYWSARSVLYHELYVANSSILPQMHDRYIREHKRCQDSLSCFVDRNTDEYLRILEKRYSRERERDKALEINDRRMEALPQDSSLVALVYFDRFATECLYCGKPIEEGLDYLLRSAIIDVRNSNQETGSAKYIIRYLFSHGYIDEAKKISDYYNQTMIRLGNRRWRVMALESAIKIDNQYVRLLSSKDRKIRTALVVIAFLSLVLLVLAILMFRYQRKIVTLNKDLRRSDAASKNYVLKFFRHYSTYIDRMEHNRSVINTMLRRGRIDELIELTNPDKEMFGGEISMMYENFDSSFLAIFPDYVSNFNSMLRPEFRPVEKAGGGRISPQSAN